MVYNSIKTYIRALDKYNNTWGKIICGNGYYLVNGHWVSDKEYFKHNSCPVYEPVPRENSDKTNIPPSIKIKKS